MSEKPESDDFDEDADIAGVDGDDATYEFMIEDLGRPKRGSIRKAIGSQTRKYREQKETAERFPTTTTLVTRRQTPSQGKPLA
jgi:transcription elongation factor